MTALRRLTARDLMNAEVMTLPASATLQEAVEWFEEYRISGAPVVDGGGEPVGVLSLSDIVKTEHLTGGRIESERGQYYLSDPLADWGEEDFGDKTDYSPDLLGRQTVLQWMTPQVISVPPDASLQRVCRTMLDQSVHRVLVVDGGSMLGIVTTTDIVRALAER